MWKTLLLALTLLSSNHIFHVSPRTCFSPCRISVQYRVYEATVVGVVIVGAEGITDVDERPNPSYTTTTPYTLTTGEYEVVLYADGRGIDRQRVTVVSPSTQP